MNKILRYLKEPWRIVVAFDRHVASIVPDKLFLKCLYRCFTGKKLNLKNPQTFNEKLQWLKLYDRNPKYCYMTDKYTARKVVENCIGPSYLIPIIKVYQNVDQINYNELPDRFVIKCSHDSGSSIICRDKNLLDFDGLKEKLSKSIKRNFWRKGRESAYNSKGKIKPCIICEEYLYGDDDISLFPDFKFFCFNGKVKVFQLNIGRNSKDGVKVNFYDRECNRIEIYENGYKTIDNIKLPNNIDEMIDIAEKLSQSCTHVRIDLMTYKDKIYFSEFTFYHCGGFVPFEPDEANLIMGDYLILPDKK